MVDEEFSKAYNVKEASALKKSLQKFIDHANWVFRSTDWNNNGKPDNIGFKAVKVSLSLNKLPQSIYFGQIR